MEIAENCPVKKQRYEDYKDYIEKIDKSLQKTLLPDLLCVAIAGGEELQDNAKYFRSNKRRKFTANLLASLLGECFAFIADIEKAVLNASYHHVRSAMELEITYNWVFHKKKKIDKKIDRYYAYRELRKFLEYEYSKNPNTPIQEMNYSNEKIQEWNDKKGYWAKLFGVDVNNLSQINNWHPKTSYQTMLEIFPHSEVVKRGYDYMSHMTHLSPLKEDFGVKQILGLTDKEGDSQNLKTSIRLIMNSLEVLYGLIDNNIGFDSQVKFPENR